jgi:two-component system sensor histidine kinase/response regulator
MQSESDSSKGRILVVDDDRIIVEILSQSLSLAGYEVITAADGQEGLELARELRPDLVLLDVMMPRLDGYSVCSELKKDPGTQFIPVIILTALTDRDDKLKALEAGADEFIRKPPDRQELLIRIKSLLRTKNLVTQVQTSAEGLRELERVRHDLTHMIVHDMRGPLSSIISVLELLLDEEATPPPEAHDRLLRNALLNGQRIMTMLEAMLDVQRMESGQMPVDLQPVSVGQVIHEAVQAIRPLLHEGKLQIDIRVNQPSSPVMLDPGLFGRLVNNLLFNAIRFSPNGGRVGIWTQATAKWVIVNVADQGPGIAKEDRERIFDKYVQLGGARDRTGLGLGLAFCKLAAGAMDGAIWVEDAPSAGALFRCALPLRLPEVDTG